MIESGGDVGFGADSESGLFEVISSVLRKEYMLPGIEGKMSYLPMMSSVVR